MRVLITGAAGQAGTELQRTAPVGAELICLDADRLDITNRAQVSALVRDIMPRLIINAAAYTAVDRAESEREAAYAVNASGIRNLTAAAADVDARVIQISTDFIFNGQKSSPYLPSDLPKPLSVYGASKKVSAWRPNTAMVAPLSYAPPGFIHRTGTTSLRPCCV